MGSVERDERMAQANRLTLDAMSGWSGVVDAMTRMGASGKAVAIAHRQKLKALEARVIKLWQ
jgi:hypothetical protein